MKNINTTLFFLLIWTTAVSQEIPLTFSFEERSFLFLDSPVAVNGDVIWDGQYSQLIDLGFPFEFVGKSFDKIEIRSGGVDFFEVGSSRSRRIFSLYKLLEDKGISESLSPISYKYEFSEDYEENIFKIEWRNAGVIPIAASSPSDFVNIQVWLHETSGNICIHFGPHQLEEGTYLNNLNSLGALGIKLLVGDDFIGPIGNGDTPGFLIAACSPNLCNTNIETYPSEEILYCFSPSEQDTTTTNIEVISESNMKIYPNPVDEDLTIEVDGLNLDKGVQLQITDIRGKSLYTLDMEHFASQVKINFSDYPKGVYLIMINDGLQKIIQKVIKG